jgi:hypothetical protein
MGLMLTSLELSKRAGIQRGTLLQWIRRKKVAPVMRIGRMYLWPIVMLKEIESIRDKGARHVAG